MLSNLPFNKLIDIASIKNADTLVLDDMVASILAIGTNMQPIIVEESGNALDPDYKVIRNGHIAAALIEANRQNDDIELANAVVVTDENREAILAQF